MASKAIRRYRKSSRWLAGFSMDKETHDKHWAAFMQIHNRRRKKKRC